MLLVQHDQPQLGDGGEDGGAGADHDARLAGLYPPPLIMPLAQRQRRMQHGHLVRAKTRFEQVQHLRRQPDLRQQDQRITPQRQCLRDGVQIDLRLARAGDAVQQQGPPRPRLEVPPDLARRPRLGVRQRRRIPRHEPEKLERVAPARHFRIARQPFLGQRLRRRPRACADREARGRHLRRPAILFRRHQGTQQPRLPGRARSFQPRRFFPGNVSVYGQPQQADHLSTRRRQLDRTLLGHDALLPQLR